MTKETQSMMPFSSRAILYTTTNLRVNKFWLTSKVCWQSLLVLLKALNFASDWSWSWGVSILKFRELGVWKFPQFSEHTICCVCCRIVDQLGWWKKWLSHRVIYQVSEWKWDRLVFAYVVLAVIFIVKQSRKQHKLLMSVI